MDLPDRITNFYQGRTIFLTGGTGFLGKTLIEKILRQCTGVKRIYLLLRTKKNKSTNQRLEEIFNNALFNQLKTQQDNFQEKCTIIDGNLSEEDLGISLNDRKELQKNVDVIIHSAASTRFDLSMKEALIINTRATKYILDLASQCKKLKVAVYISTAFAFPHEDILFEKPYKPPVDPHEALKAINWIEEDVNGSVTKNLLKDNPNTYTFSKALAEALVVEQFEKLPVIIARPSIVIPILKTPLPGWCNNLQGPMGLLVAAGKGVIRSMYLKGDACVEAVPADIVTDAILLAAWDFINFNGESRIFNITNSGECKISWAEMVETGKEVCLNKLPFNSILWYPGGSLKQSKLVHLICFYLFQLIPAIFIDGLLILFRYKPVLYQIQKRIEKGGEMFEFFTTKQWHFDKSNAIKGRKNLNKKEKSIYQIEVTDLNLSDYLYDCVLTVRRHILNETDDMIPAAKRNMRIMWAVDRLLKILVVILVLHFVFRLFS